jgi:hypothetical protein
MCSMRWLVCLDLQQSWVAAHAGEPEWWLQRRIDAARTVLRQAREAGWSIAHVHRGSPHSDGVVHIGRSRPLDGLRPLPTEPLFHREQLCAFESRAFADALRGTPRAKLAILTFDVALAGLISALTGADLGHQVTLLEDGLSGDSALIATGNLIATLADTRLSVCSFKDLQPQPVAPKLRLVANNQT